MHSRHIVRSIMVVVGALVVVSGDGKAQVVDSPINDLLGSAKGALNDLKFLKADSIARQVLALGSQLRRSQKVLAWQILAAAQYPEQGAARDTAAARLAMREAIHLDLDALLPLDIRWSGLEALRTDELRTAFGLAVRIPAGEIAYGGAAGDAIIRVATSQPSTVWLLARALNGGTEMILDSAVISGDAAMRIRALQGTTPVLSSGAYQFVVRARATSGGEVVERSLQASVDAPALELEGKVAPLDSTKLLPEISKSNRSQGIATGIVVGAFTIAVNQLLRGNAPINKLGADGRADVVGVLLAAGTIAAVWFDPGKVIKKNREVNDRLKKDALQRVAAMTTENEKRTSGYRAKLNLLLEDK